MVIYAQTAYTANKYTRGYMGANILRLLSLIGGYKAISALKEPSEATAMKQAEKKARMAYGASPAHMDRLATDEYEFNKLRNKLK